MADDRTWSVGDPRNPTDDDERFLTQPEAEQYARDTSEGLRLASPGRTRAVWDDESGEMIALAFDGRLFVGE